MPDQKQTAELDPKAETQALGEATLNAIWRQWAAIGAAASAGQARALVDPEGLVLTSLSLMDEEPRLRDVIASWVSKNAQQLSVQRIKNVAALFPGSIEERLPSLARLAVEEGKDFRWKSLARPEVSGMDQRRGGKELSVAVPMERPQALMLRMRALLGVGLRTDVITFFLTAPEAILAAEDVAAATAYNLASVRRVLVQLTEAGGLRFASGVHSGYSIKESPLRGITALRASELPRWRYVTQVYSLLVEYLKWWRKRESLPLQHLAFAVKGDELFERHRRAFIDTRLVEPLRKERLGDTWPWELRQLATWLDEVV